MAILQNWAFILKDYEDSDFKALTVLHVNNEHVKKLNSDKFVTIIGEVYDKPGYNDGDIITISSIKVFDEKNSFVKTSSGSKYFLGEKSNYYKAYEMAIEKNVPVVVLKTIGRSPWGRLFIWQANSSKGKPIICGEDITGLNHKNFMIETEYLPEVFIDWYSSMTCKNMQEILETSELYGVDREALMNSLRCIASDCYMIDFEELKKKKFKKFREIFKISK